MADYDNWFYNELTALIQAVLMNDHETIIAKVSEVRRGISYSTQSPGSINELLARIGQGVIGPIIVDYKLDKNTEQKQEQVNVDELKAAITRHKKDKVVNRLSGSLSALEEYDD